MWVEYGVVVWVPAAEEKGLDECFVTAPEHRIVETIGEALEFIKKFNDVCKVKIYRIAGDNDLENFCEEIGWEDTYCELLEKHGG